MPRQQPPLICAIRLRGFTIVPTSPTLRKSTQLHDAGFDIDFDFREAGDEGIGVAIARIHVLRHAHQSEAGVEAGGGLRHGVNVGRQLVTVELAAERNRAGRRLRVGQAARRIAFPEHALVADRVVVRRSAEILRGNLLQLLLRIHRAGVIGARHRVRRLAADRQAGPRQALAGIAPVDDDFLPRHLEHVGRNAREIDHRVRAEIADAGLHVELAVRPDRHQPVETDRSGAMRADRHADAGDLRSVRLPARAARAAQSNCCAPRSSASFTKALVMWRRPPFASGGP